MINYLIQQINSMEQTVTTNRRQMADLQERDRDNFLRAKQDLTSNVETSQLTLNDLTLKLKNMEEFQQRTEITKNELKNQLKQSEENN
jgi:hypothetical protein